MKLKTLAIVVVVLAAVAGGAYLLRDRDPETQADPRAGAPLVESSLLAEASSLRITGENGAAVTLKRTAPGSWAVEDYHGLPVDFEKLARLTRDLEKAKVSRFVTRNPERVSRLELEKLSLAIGDGWKVALGRSAEGGGRFVRFGTEDGVYQTDFDGWIDTSARSWAAQELTQFKAEEVRSVQVAFKDGTTAAFSRETREAAFAPAPGVVPEGAEFKASTLNTVVSSLGSLRFTDTTETSAENAVAAREHAATYTFELFNGGKLTVAVGRKPAPPPAPKPEPAPAADGEAPTTPPPSVPEAPAPQPGPVYAFVSSSDAAAPVNAMMEKRAFTIGDWIASQLPTDITAFHEKKPEPAPAAASAATPPVTVEAPQTPERKRVEVVSPVYTVPAPEEPKP